MSLSRALSACLILLLAACASEPDVSHAESQRQKLLETYPLEKTTQRDVSTSFRRMGEIQRKRPAGGWETEPDWGIRSYAARAEGRIGREIAYLERYNTPEGSSGLSYSWFYYDAKGRLIDAEWQWSQD